MPFQSKEFIPQPVKTSRLLLAYVWAEAHTLRLNQLFSMRVQLFNDMLELVQLLTGFAQLSFGGQALVV